MKRSTFLALLAAGLPLALGLPSCSDNPQVYSESTALNKPGGGTTASPELVFKTATTSKGNTYNTISLMEDDGTGQKVLYRAATTTAGFGMYASPTWSATGTSISFAEYSGTNPGTTKIMKQDVAGGSATMLVQLTVPNTDRTQIQSQAWAPGTQSEIGFVLAAIYNGFDATSWFEIRVVPASGGTQTVVYRSPEGQAARYMAWSPDGSRIAFDGIDYATGNRWIKILNRSTGLIEQTLFSGQFNIFSGIDWSRDGNYLAFGASDGATPGHAGNKVYVYNLNGSSNPTALANGANPSWSPDGASVVYEQVFDLTYIVKIHKSNVATGAQTTLFTSPSGGAWPRSGFPNWKR